MRMRLAASLAYLLLAGPALAQSSQDPKQAPTGAYTLDSRHSQVLFAIPHLGVTDYHGRFDKVTGSLNYNAGAPEKSSTSVIIDMTSIDTPSRELTGELMGPNVFKTADFPTAAFKSTSIVRTGPTSGKITGDLTIRGVTKPVTLDATFGGLTTDPFSGADDIGFRATATIKRADFGLTGMVWEPVVGEEVTLTIEALFQHPKGK
ncbi:MAG TPA: YceI family protein [Rhizomicrobium sp.]|jgi:polyisoprenoid-binding protein YceI|nr:YceI family protein [Rhizomicrobium sp.]